MMIPDINHLYLPTQMEMQNIYWHERRNILLSIMRVPLTTLWGSDSACQNLDTQASFRCAKGSELRLIPPNTGLNYHSLSVFSGGAVCSSLLPRDIFIVRNFHSDLRPLTQCPSTNFKTSVINPSYEIEISYSASPVRPPKRFEAKTCIPHHLLG
jgi:hypothetical protein